MSDPDDALFGRLPPGLFGLLASAPRRAYARLLLSVYREFYADALVSSPTQRHVVEHVGEEMRRAGLADDSGEAEITQDPRAAYQRLRDAGWLIEHRQGYAVLVELQPEVSALLACLSDIERGGARRYGGTVASILSVLEAARGAPVERAQSIADTAERAREFLRHLRAVIGGLREVERRILADPSLANIMKRFFADFVSEMLIADYRLLKTRNNPFRFRDRIVAMAREFAEDEALQGALALGYVEQGMSPNAAAAHEDVLGHLRAIERAFLLVGDQIEEIDAFRARLERRITNTVLYMEMAGGSLTGRISGALAKLCAEGRPWSAAMPVAVDLIDPSQAWSNEQLYRPRTARKIVAARPIAAAEPDPALLAYHAMKRAYQARIAIGADQARAYIERHLNGRDQISAADLTIETLEDFLIFQRLAALPFLHHGALAKAYRIETRPDAIHESPWLTGRDFTIARTPRATSAET